MPLRRKILRGLYRLGTSHHLHEEDAGHQLQNGKKSTPWKVGWRLAVSTGKRNVRKTRTRRARQGDRIRNPLISSLVSLIKSKKRPTLPTLERSILLKIYEHLTLVDRACLSLSCKSLFRIFGTVLKHAEFTFPCLLQIRIPILCVNSERVPRNQLLLRLENRYWAYCAKCLRLHPRHEFNGFSLHHPPKQRSCRKGAGIVDICPCTAWTIRDRAHIVDLLKSPDTPSKFRFGQFEFDRDDRPRFTHCCSFGSGSDYIVQAAFALIIDDSNFLGLYARYTIYFSSPKTYLTAEPVFCCPHHTLASMVNTKTPRQICSICRTVVIKRNALSRGRMKVVFNVIRALGTCEGGAGSSWVGNCRLTGARLRDNDIYW